MLPCANTLDLLASMARLMRIPTLGQEGLSEVLKILDESLDLKRGTIMLLSPSGDTLRAAAAAGSDPDRMASAVYRMGEGITGRVLETGTTAVVPRIADEPSFAHRLYTRKPEDRERAFICVPITLGNQTIGTLAADCPPNDLSRHQALLTVVAAVIAHDAGLRRIADEERLGLEAENLRLRERLGKDLRPEGLIGSSASMREVFVRVTQVASSDATVLLLGESGTGKERVASALHYASKRSKRPFVRVNCAALTESLLDSELFGHEKGAFTGASMRRIGRFEEADGGTLFLDEIGEFPISVQAKLLRALQEREFQRIGSNQIHKADVRIIAATNRDLSLMVKEGTFRLDLFYRINVFPISLPPLRERRDDILPLANHFIDIHSKRQGKKLRRISTQAIGMLLAYHWPGNVRELENALEYAAVVADGTVVRAQHLPPTLQMPRKSETLAKGDYTTQVEALQRDLITDALKRSDGNYAAAARVLGTTPRVIRHQVKVLNIPVEQLFPGINNGPGQPKP